MNVKRNKHKNIPSFGYLHLHKNSHKISTSLLLLSRETKLSCRFVNIKAVEHLSKWIKSSVLFIFTLVVINAYHRAQKQPLTVGLL